MEYYKVAFIALLASISPGPDFIVVVKNAITYNRFHGILTSIGIGFGLIIQCTTCILGLTLILSQSIILFRLIAYCGAAYLFYLGSKNLFSKENPLSAQATIKTRTLSYWQPLCNGLFTNLLNPKCTLFLFSLFSLVIKPETPSSIQITYGIEVIIISTLWFTFLSYALTCRMIKIKIERIQNLASKLIGLILIILAIKIIFFVPLFA